MINIAFKIIILGYLLWVFIEELQWYLRETGNLKLGDTLIFLELIEFPVSNFQFLSAIPREPL